MASQPNGAHTLFPSNDHPLDKATFTLRLTAPAGMLGVATGARVAQIAHEDGSITTTWESGAPVATHVLAVGVGRIAVIESDVPGGPRLRSAVPAALAPISGYRLDDLAGAVAWLEAEVGLELPFGSIGVQFAPVGTTGAVLEGQTLILMEAGLLDPRVSDCTWQALLVHEVAHQWFGDSVSLVSWDESGWRKSMPRGTSAGSRRCRAVTAWASMDAWRSIARRPRPRARGWPARPPQTRRTL